MSRPLYRGFTGSSGRLSTGSGIGDSFNKSYQLKDFSEIGFGHELLNPFGTSKSRRSLTLGLLKLGVAGVIFLALLGLLFWVLCISTSSQAILYRGYRRLQEQLVADLSVVGELSLGIGKLKELEFCPSDYENYVPCYFNISESSNPAELDGKIDQYERSCVHRSAKEQGCLVLPPKNYKIPLRWPTGRDFIWKYNVKITGQELSSGSLTKRMMVEEEQLSFHSDSLMVDGVEDYSHQIAEMIGLRNESNFNEAGVRTVLDIGCGFGSFGAHLFAKHLLTMCIANYEGSGSQVQLTLERGLPAMVGSFATKQLPYPNLSFDMVHCARCGIEWERNDGIFVLEVDRLLRPGGYFVWTSLTNTHRSLHNKENQKRWTLIRDFTESICWDLLSQQDETIIWKKTSKKKCYSSRKSVSPICDRSLDMKSLYYQPLNPCIGGTTSQRWIPIEDRRPWPSQVMLSSAELSLHGVQPEEFFEDSLNWELSVQNYWSLLSPLIFSDHPKRPGDEDPSPPYNMLRNVLDMNARFGGFNAALLEAGKSVWVMNVVPVTSHNSLPLIFDRGFIGVQHDWCEAFPTYPRTYDMVHAQGLLSIHKHHGCSVLDVFLEIDRILRPEGWIIIQDAAPLIEAIRTAIPQLKWDARVTEISGNKDDRLLVCQKPFFKKQIQ
ncbi:probable pectin methyltransferase QUA2 [Dendrobium catenatum]|uniref:Methyltransferase n=1 Tax=Dendrobium catenatum TaxID=906689 RepID=A0A2I0W9V6_9ASPA|nr:probable pectin methyltransferase QUA2 [Dendrobium catenatum]XP_020691150.1 probable pectin methyltransferase QUA2 [Dendrobium catenatum]PKU72434.1 putative pectin methyltransferase QUA2 [Dendrobium catenatum]